MTFGTHPVFILEELAGSIFDVVLLKMEAAGLGYLFILEELAGSIFEVVLLKMEAAGFFETLASI